MRHPPAALTGCADVCACSPREITSETSRKLRECAAKLRLPQHTRHEDWVESCLTLSLLRILFVAQMSRMLQVTLSSCGNPQPCAGVMLQHVSPYFLKHIVPARVGYTWFEDIPL